MDEKELQKLIDDAKDAIKTDFDKKVKDIQDASEKTKTEKDAEIKQLKADMTKLSNQYDDTEKALAELKKRKAPESVKQSFMSEYQKSLNEMFVTAKGLADDKTEVNFKADLRHVKGQEFTVKAAALSTTASSLNSAQIFLTLDEVDKEIYKAPKTPTSVLEMIRVVPTMASTVYWRERVTTEGKPVTVAEAATFPREQLKYETQNEKVKKIAVFSGYTAEMVEDTDFFKTELPMELQEDTMLELEKQVYEGDGTGNNFNGLLTIATAFVRPAGVEQQAGVTRAEVLRHAILLIRKQEYKANAIFLNPTDCALMEFQKGSDGHYVLPPFTSADGTKIKGIPVIETNRVAEGAFMVGDMTKTKLKMKRDVEYKIFDQDAQNAKDDIFECTMSLRAVLVTPRPHRKAFVKGTFATAITALQAA